MSRELEQLDKSRTSCSSSKGQRTELTRQTEQKEGVETQLPVLEDNQEVISTVVVVVMFLSLFLSAFCGAASLGQSEARIVNPLFHHHTTTTSTTHAEHHSSQQQSRASSLLTEINCLLLLLLRVLLLCRSRSRPPPPHDYGRHPHAPKRPWASSTSRPFGCGKPPSNKQQPER